MTPRIKEWQTIREKATAYRKYPTDEDRAHDYAHHIVALIKGGEFITRDMNTLIESIKEYGFELSIGKDGQITGIFKPEDC